MSHDRQRRIAITALVLSVVLALGSLVAWAAVVSGTRSKPVMATARSHPSGPTDPSASWISSPVRDLKVGDCGLQPANLGYITYLTLVPCRQRHDFEVYAIFLLPAGAYPGIAKVRRLADRGCAARFSAFLRTTRSRRDLQYSDIHPLPQAWNLDQFVHCLALTGASRRGSAGDQSV